MTDLALTSVGLYANPRAQDMLSGFRGVLVQVQPDGGLMTVASANESRPFGAGPSEIVTDDSQANVEWFGTDTGIDGRWYDEGCPLRDPLVFRFVFEEVRKT